jgi:hypothetical protein
MTDEKFNIIWKNIKETENKLEKMEEEYNLADISKIKDIQIVNKRIKKSKTKPKKL